MDPNRLSTEFAGRRWRLFKLAVKTGFLTILTLGFYRFWMKTRLRRWYWSAIRPGGQPLEYVGNPYEKLLGFLIAVVILAFYIGIVNLLLMFVSFSLFQGNTTAYVLSFLGVIPIWFYAQYRARRYVLARTRWRGLRFGLEPGAWGYAFRALGYWLLTIVSAGLLLPLMTFRLEKYKTDRTFFGNTRMRQGGRWTMLYGSLKWVGIAIVMGLLATVLILAEAIPPGVILAVIASALGLFGLVYYRVDSLRRMTTLKTLEGSGLYLTASPMRVLGISVLGYFIASIVVGVLLMLLGALVASTLGPETLIRLGLEDAPDLMMGTSRWIIVSLSIVTYFTIFLMWTTLTNVFVTMPIIRHYAEGLLITGATNLGAIRQRPRDEHTEAEGFAEALDVGASL